MQMLNIMAYIVFLFVSILVIFWFGFGVGYQYYRQRVLKSITKATEHITKEQQERLISLRTIGKDVPDFSRIINGIHYKTLDAKCIAQGGAAGYWTWLMQTNNKSFFFVIQSPLDLGIVPATRELAMEVFSHAQKQEVKFQDAFPETEIKDA